MMKKTDWYFHFTTENGHDIVWAWGREVSDKIYYTTWRPKAENIDIITKGLSPEDQQAIRESILKDLKPELDHHIKKRVRR
jgi:hypothetical protein